MKESDIIHQHSQCVLWLTADKTRLHSGERSCFARKRRIIAKVHIMSIEKRYPQRIEMHGILKTQAYTEMMRHWQHSISNGRWNETDNNECKYLQGLGKYPLPIIVVNLLQCVNARSIRSEFARAQNLLKVCDRLIPNVTGDNRTFLFGRLKYVMSWLHKRLKQFEEAKEHAENALQILFNVEPGEDTAAANYTYGRTIMIMFGSDRKEMKTAEDCLRFAIDHTRIDRGLNHDDVEVYSHLLLARACISSTHYEPGKNITPNKSEEANNHLKAVDLGSLRPAPQCMFFLIETKLYESMGKVDMAIESASHALKISKRNGLLRVFSTEELSYLLSF